ncbi:phosphoribosyltransferase [Kitasatospora cineracea]
MASTPATTRSPGTGPVRLAWSEVEGLVDTITRAVAEGGRPDTVVAVVRGGLVPAALAAHRLGVRDVRALEVTRTVDDTVDAPKTFGPRVRNAASLGDLSGLDVLIAEDVAGTGETIEAVADLVRLAGAARVRTAVLVVNQANWTRKRPPADTVDHIGTVVRTWVVFPWENTPAAGGGGAS